MAIVQIVRGRPRRDNTPQQAPDRPPDARLPRRRAEGQPPAVPVLDNLIETELAHHETHRGRDRRGQHEPRDAAQRALADGDERGLLAALAAEPGGLQRAHVARHQREDGVADAALDEDPEEGELQEARRGGGLAGEGREEFGVPGPREVCEDYRGGGEAAEALGECVSRV